MFSRKALTLALLLSPMIFMGAECDPTGPANTPLAMDAMRAEVSGEGSFFCDDVTASDNGTFWKVVARGGGTLSDDRVIELDIPKRTSVPFTIAVENDDKGVIYYCVPLNSTSCKNFYADKEHGGTGTITITNITGHLEGTFRGTVQLSNGNETRTVSGGEFKADL